MDLDEDLLDSEIERCFGVNVRPDSSFPAIGVKRVRKIILRHIVSDTPVRSEPFAYEFTLKGESPTLNENSDDNALTA